MKNFLTTRELAQYLRLKPLAIYRMVRAKRIPYLRANRSLRFDLDEVNKWLRSER